jgi:hypothetical protein
VDRRPLPHHYPDQSYRINGEEIAPPPKKLIVEKSGILLACFV